MQATLVADVAQLVEREALNLVVAGSSPVVGFLSVSFIASFLPQTNEADCRLRILAVKAFGHNRENRNLHVQNTNLPMAQVKKWRGKHPITGVEASTTRLRASHSTG